MREKKKKNKWLIKNKLFFGIDLLLYEPALKMLLAVAEFFSLVNKNDVLARESWLNVLQFNLHSALIGVFGIPLAFPTLSQ